MVREQVIAMELEHTCTIGDCQRPLDHSGMCRAHLDRLSGRIDPSKPMTPFIASKCALTLCKSVALASGICVRHYNQCNNHKVGIERFIELDAMSNGYCHSCRTAPWACVDHDHSCCYKSRSCGKCVRGFLCNGCNVGIGQFNDNVNLLRSAVVYLQATLQGV